MAASDARVWLADCQMDFSKFLKWTEEKRCDVKQMLAFRRRAHAGEPLGPDRLPDFFLRKTDEAKPLRDYGRISGEVDVVSDRFIETLQAFDLGDPDDTATGGRSVEFHTLEVHAAEGEEPIEYCKMMHVATRKDSLLPELSSGINIHILPTIRIRHAPYPPPYLALKPSCLEGADLWREAKIVNGYFFSDRLKRAVEDAGIEGIGFFPCGITQE